MAPDLEREETRLVGQERSHGGIVTHMADEHAHSNARANARVHPRRQRSAGEVGE